MLAVLPRPELGYLTHELRDHDGVEAIGGDGGGGMQAGGDMDVRSYNGPVLGTVAATLDASGGAGGTPGSIQLRGCAGAVPA